MASSAVEAPSRAKVALELACARLLALQHEGGWWQGELQTNVTMDAEDMLLRDLPVRQNLCRRSLVFHRLTHEPENPLRLEKRRFLE